MLAYLIRNLVLNINQKSEHSIQTIAILYLIMISYTRVNHLIVTDIELKENFGRYQVFILQIKFQTGYAKWAEQI